MNFISSHHVLFQMKSGLGLTEKRYWIIIDASFRQIHLDKNRFGQDILDQNFGYNTEIVASYNSKQDPNQTVLALKDIEDNITLFKFSYRMDIFTEKNKLFGEVLLVENSKYEWQDELKLYEPEDEDEQPLNNPVQKRNSRSNRISVQTPSSSSGMVIS